jgi:hypothetical protein
LEPTDVIPKVYRDYWESRFTFGDDVEAVVEGDFLEGDRGEDVA